MKDCDIKSYFIMFKFCVWLGLSWSQGSLLITLYVRVFLCLFEFNKMIGFWSIQGVCLEIIVFLVLCNWWLCYLLDTEMILFRKIFPMLSVWMVHYRLRKLDTVGDFLIGIWFTRLLLVRWSGLLWLNGGFEVVFIYLWRKCHGFRRSCRCIIQWWRCIVVIIIIFGTLSWWLKRPFVCTYCVSFLLFLGLWELVHQSFEYNQYFLWPFVDIIYGYKFCMGAGCRYCLRGIVQGSIDYLSAHGDSMTFQYSWIRWGLQRLISSSRNLVALSNFFFG